MSTVNRFTRIGAPLASSVALGLIASFGLAQPAAGRSSTGKPPVRSSCDTSVPGILGALGGLEQEQHPKELSGPLEAPILERFAIFSRPAQLSDELPALNPAADELDVQISAYYPDYVRRLVSLPDGVRYFVIPAFERAVRVPAARCLPASLRSRRSELVEGQRKLASEPSYCVVSAGADAKRQIEPCEPFANIDQSAELFRPASSEGPVVDLVPDGVASVRIDYRTGSPLVASVQENAFVFTAPPSIVHRFRELITSASDGLSRVKHPTKAQSRRALKVLNKRIDRALDETEPAKVEWLNAAGTVLRSISPPPNTGGFGSIVDLSTTFTV
jgi:hypothetical protein